MENNPEFWVDRIPQPGVNDHKYTRGQVLVLGGSEMAGACCLAAHAASRIGAGLVTIVCPATDFPLREGKNNDAALIYKTFMPHLIVREGLGFLDYLKRAELKGICASILGPGMGVDEPEILCRLTQDTLKRMTPLVLDADVLNVYEWHVQDLISYLHKGCVLTPHEGEFCRLFPELKELLQEDRCLAAAKAADKIEGVLVLKGSETIVSASGRESVVNKVSSPYLATAGSGDVLSGMIAGLQAQGMSAFDAACAAVWMHGRTGQVLGAGLIASDLPDNIPLVLQEVLGFLENLG